MIWPKMITGRCEIMQPVSYMSRVINNFLGKKMHTKCKNIDLFLLTIFIYGSSKKPDEEKNS